MPSPLPEPFSQPLLVNVVRRYGQHCLLGIIHVWGVWTPLVTIQVQEEDERRPRGPLVPIEQWVVPGQSACQDSRLVDEIRIELLASEAGLWSMERRIGEFKSKVGRRAVAPFCG